MRRLITLTMLLAAFAMTVPAAYAGPGCCAKKKGAKIASTAGFPAMLAKESGKKTVFVVGGEEFVSEAKAMSALADASEQFVGQFVAISCVVDGKVIRCDEAKKACGSMAGKAGCDKMAKGGCSKMAKAGKGGCSKMAKAGKGGCSKMAKAGKDCCKDGKGCTEAKKAKGTCCSSKKGKVAKADAKGCGSKSAKAGCGSKAGKGCDKMAKAGGKSCHGAGKTKADSKDCCPEGKNVIFRVAGKEFKSKDAAIAAHKQITAAIKKIQMTYMVDGEAVHCSSEITDKAKAAGKVKYCVGKSKTSCHLTARVELAKAQYEAAKSVSGKLVAKAL